MKSRAKKLRSSDTLRTASFVICGFTILIVISKKNENLIARL